MPLSQAVQTDLECESLYNIVHSRNETNKTSQSYGRLEFVILRIEQRRPLLFPESDPIPRHGAFIFQIQI